MGTRTPPAAFLTEAENSYLAAHYRQRLQSIADEERVTARRVE